MAPLPGDVAKETLGSQFTLIHPRPDELGQPHRNRGGHELGILGWVTHWALPDGEVFEGGVQWDQLLSGLLGEERRTLLTVRRQTADEADGELAIGPDQAWRGLDGERWGDVPALDDERRPARIGEEPADRLVRCHTRAPVNERALDLAIPNDEIVQQPTDRDLDRPVEGRGHEVRKE